MARPTRRSGNLPAEATSFILLLIASAIKNSGGFRTIPARMQSGPPFVASISTASGPTRENCVAPLNRRSVICLPFGSMSSVGATRSSLGTAQHSVRVEGARPGAASYRTTKPRMSAMV